MAEPSTELGSAATADGLTEDRWLGGRLMLVQPKRGHRVGTDAALLVAAAGDARQGRIVDVGAGVGAVGLALAKRNPLASADLVEIDRRTGAARRKQRRAQRASAARPRPAARRAQSERAPRGGARGDRPIASSPTRRSSTPDGPRLSRRRQSARACLGPGGGGATLGRLDSSLARHARARRPVRDDPPARRARR